MHAWLMLGAPTETSGDVKPVCTANWAGKGRKPVGACRSGFVAATAWTVLPMGHEVGTSSKVGCSGGLPFRLCGCDSVDGAMGHAAGASSKVGVKCCCQCPKIQVTCQYHAVKPGCGLPPKGDHKDRVRLAARGACLVAAGAA